MTRRTWVVGTVILVLIGLTWLLAYLGGERPLQRMEAPVDAAAVKGTGA